MRISDWSSDVCSSDLLGAAAYAEFRGAVDTLFDKAAMLAAAGGPDVPLGALLAGDHTWRPAIEAIFRWITSGRHTPLSAVDLGNTEDPRVHWSTTGGSLDLNRQLPSTQPVTLLPPGPPIHRARRKI